MKHRQQFCKFYEKVLLFTMLIMSRQTFFIIIYKLFNENIFILREYVTYHVGKYFLAVRIELTVA
jgi:hypothetical protein